MGVARLIANPLVPSHFPRSPSTKAPFLHRRYPASAVLRASPPPQTASLTLTSRRLIQLRSPLGFPVLPLVPVAACRRHYPGRTDEPVRSYCSIGVGLPRMGDGSAPALIEACSAFTRVTACLLTKSPLRPFLAEGFSSFVTSTTASVLAGGTNQLPGGTYFHPLWTSAFSRRTVTVWLRG